MKVLVRSCDILPNFTQRIIGPLGDRAICPIPSVTQPWSGGVKPERVNQLRVGIDRAHDQLGVGSRFSVTKQIGNSEFGNGGVR